MPDSSLYNRLGAYFPSPQWLTTSATPSCGTRSQARDRIIRLAENGTRTTSAGCRASSSCAPCGRATSAGGPFQFTATRPGSTKKAHRELRISPEQFDEVAAEVGRTLDFVQVPQRALQTDIA